MKRLFLLSLTLLLASCGTLPQPFYGNPGSREAHILSLPPPAILIVPTPVAAQLQGQATAQFAKDLAEEMVAHDVPSVAGPARKGNWQLAVSASRSGNFITPAYKVLGPDGKTYGTQAGAPLAAGAWAAGDPAALEAAAKAAAPGLTALMTKINARIQQSDPNSLEHRTPRVYIGSVTGAPGDGDNSLPLNLARDLPGPDIELVKAPNEADFTVTGRIKTAPAPQGQIEVQLTWTVRDRYNRIAGEVTQLHDLDPSDIEPYWGDVAAAAAAEAAGGITTVVQNELLKKKYSDSN